MAHNRSTSPAIADQPSGDEITSPPSDWKSFFPLEYPAYPTNDVNFDEWTDYAAYCGLGPEPQLLNLLSNEDHASLDIKYFTPQPAKPVTSKNLPTGVSKMQVQLGIHSFEVTAAQPTKPASLIVKLKLPTDKVTKILSLPQAAENPQARDIGEIGENKKPALRNTKVPCRH
ncbi:hypothetical protein OCU04_013136 [Sclerotinia nivalis]|uniref:Uncharacterized protein n=1 Tax=Sclerotinia nivalis TaxID=352851 RepID=A0A9X0DDW0_9HELO|nr:hypothetical protein OCU04_013136 [Sclerotinia nivalis]